MLNSKTIGKLGSFILFFIAFGFPIQSFIPFILNANSNPINIAFRVFFLALSLYLIFITSFMKNKSRSSNKGWFFFILFWFIYSIRLIYDIEIKGLRYLDTEPFYVYSFAFGVSLASSIAVHKTLPFSDIKQSIKLMFWIVLLSNFCLFYALLSFSNWNFFEVLLSRGNVNIVVDGQTTSIVNPITIGFSGQVLAILAVHFLNFPLYKNPYFKYLLYLCLLLGVINLIFGASRGPMLFFVALLLFEFYLTAKKRKYIGVFLLKVSFVTLITISYLISLISAKLEDGDIEIINRFSSTYEEKQLGEKEERDYEWESAWRQFKANPILGDAFVCDIDNSYPHNLFLDILMSTGIIGALIFSAFLFFLFSKLRWIIQNLQSAPHLVIFFILFITTFLGSLLSGGIFTSSNLWLLASAILALK